jgi:hypothetical protein
MLNTRAKTADCGRNTFNMGIRKMKFLIWIVFLVATFSGCSLSQQNSSFTNSSIQIIDMGKFKGLMIIEIASINYPDSTANTHTKPLFTEIDKDNFSESLIQSFKKSDVRVLPSAQTKIHIDFTQIAMLEDTQGTTMMITADLAVSRNGIVTRKTIEINSKSNITLGRTKDTAVKMFIQKLGELLREQSSFKR